MQSRGPTWVLGTYAMYTIWNHLHEIGQREDGEMFVPMSDPERWRITAGRRFCPMVGFYRNAIETARADRRARRALVWECVALQHQLAVLKRRRTRRLRFRPIDRLFWDCASD